MYFSTDARTSFAFLYTSFKEPAVTKIFVSSAKSTNSASSEQFVMSFMYSRKRSGPRTLPCGTLHRSKLGRLLTQSPGTHKTGIGLSNSF